MADFKSDIEIARAAKKQPIMKVGAKLGIPEEHLLPYGHDKAKISAEFIKAQRGKKDGKLFDYVKRETPSWRASRSARRWSGDGSS